MVYFNRDSGTRFDEILFGPTDTVTYGVCAGDFDGDGFPDVAVANSDDLNRVFLNQVKKDL